MRVRLPPALLALIWLHTTAADVALHNALPVMPPGLARRLARRARSSSAQPAFVMQQHSTARLAGAAYEAHTLATPISHFPSDERYEPHLNETFAMRYWFDATHYTERHGPVFILLGGETDGAGRLPFLAHGILPRLAEPTHGLSIVLEHRYYGESWPTANLTTDELRFLNTQQALADVAHFIRHADVPGVGRLADAPVIVYGGS